MGMHYGLIAVPCHAEQFRQAFNEVWPNHEIIASERVADLDSFFSWSSQHAKFVSARDSTPENPGVDTYAIGQDGDWTIFLDAGKVLSSNDKALSKLSTIFGRCLSFVIETSAGCAFFFAYENGTLRRRILQMGDEYQEEGTALHEEAALPKGHFYMEEFEALQKQFGLQGLSAPLPGGYLAIATADRTDYAALRAKRSKPG